jgi:hypothetical protein
MAMISMSAEKTAGRRAFGVCINITPSKRWQVKTVQGGGATAEANVPGPLKQRQTDDLNSTWTYLAWANIS